MTPKLHQNTGHICDLNCAAALPVYEMMGCLSVRVIRTAWVALGSEQCEFVTNWRGRK